jgi:DNA damage-binding protein 1
MSSEVSHYVVTAHPPGGVLCVAKGNFLETSQEEQICIAKSRRLELRIPNNEEDAPFPIVLSVPINGRIICMLPIPWRNPLTNKPLSLLFILTVNFQYAVLRLGRGNNNSNNSNNNSNSPYPVQTLASGHIRPSLLGKPADGAPLVTLDPLHRCLALHLYDGFLTLIPIHANYTLPGYAANSTKGGGTTSTTLSSLLADPYHIRIEELNVLDLVFLESTTLSHQLAILQQDARGMQHVNVYMVDLQARQLYFQWKKQRLDGGSATLIAVPGTMASAAAAAAAAPAASAASSSSSSSSSNTGGGVLVLGQRQITYLCDARTNSAGSGNGTYVVPLPTALLLSHCPLPPSPTTGAPRYLLGDEFGNVHMLTIPILGAGAAAALELDTLGSTNVLSSAMVYMEPGWVFCGSQLGDSQLLQIHPTLNAETGSYLSVLDEFINLGPIVDMDVTSNEGQNQQSASAVVTASGSSTSGTVRLVRNGIGMKEYAAVELTGIQNMWAVRNEWRASQDTYLVQSFVAETRILGVVPTSSSPTNMDDSATMQEDDDEGATLEEVVLPGLDSTTSSLYVGNVEQGDLVVQITESEIRLLRAFDGSLVTTWTSEGDIAVAAANEAGQIVVALRGGNLMYLQIVVADGAPPQVQVVGKTQLSSEVSCLNVNPFSSSSQGQMSSSSSAMDTDSRPTAESSAIVTVGLWDDFTVRVLTLDTSLQEVLQIHLSTEEEDANANADASAGGSSPARRNRNNMMARSLCLVTLDSSTTSNGGTNKEGSGRGVDMLFVGLGDGTLISFAVMQDNNTVTVQSKKEVSLGTQRINLIPLQTEMGGTCVLATGDRPTVIYLAGGGSRNLTPKLCYSNVNLSTDDEGDDGNMPPAESIAVNVAAPFFSPQLFDDSSLSRKHYSLCVSDDSILRLGVIDDIQKLHVTTCRLGMAPRRVVHCPEGRLFAVGCIESGIVAGSAANSSQQADDSVSMGNCIRFLDETTFDDIERYVCYIMRNWRYIY